MCLKYQLIILALVKPTNRIIFSYKCLDVKLRFEQGSERTSKLLIKKRKILKLGKCLQPKALLSIKC